MLNRKEMRDREKFMALPEAERTKMLRKMDMRQRAADYAVSTFCVLSLAFATAQFGVKTAAKLGVKVENNKICSTLFGKAISDIRKAQAKKLEGGKFSLFSK